MEVLRVLNDSSRSIAAVVKVTPGEVADIEAMARLVDGNIGNFGVHVELVKTGESEPEYSDADPYDKRAGSRVSTQFGFPAVPGQDEVRYYKVSVYRD